MHWVSYYCESAAIKGEVSGATLRFKVPGAFLIFDTVKTGSKPSEKGCVLSSPAARKTQPKRGQMNRGGTSAPLDEVLDNIVRGQPPTEDIPWRGRSNSAESCAPASKVLACLKCELALPLVQLIG